MVSASNELHTVNASGGLSPRHMEETMENKLQAQIHHIGFTPMFTHNGHTVRIWQYSPTMQWHFICEADDTGHQLYTVPCHNLEHAKALMLEYVTGALNAHMEDG